MKKKKELQDKIWMNYAWILANKAKSMGEVPVGAVLIFDNRIIGAGYNSSILKNDPSAHAEIIALRDGGKILKNYRLINSTIYVTLEPCIMCLGAIINSRIKRLVLGTKPLKKRIKLYNTIDILKEIKKNKKIKVDTSISSKIYSNFIKDFFIRKRN